MLAHVVKLVLVAADRLVETAVPEDAKNHVITNAKDLV